MYFTLVNLKMIEVVNFMYLKPTKQSLGLCVIFLTWYVYLTTIFLKNLEYFLKKHLMKAEGRVILG